jgi:membrane-bound lytic murein transglycosylase B
MICSLHHFAILGMNLNLLETQRITIDFRFISSLNHLARTICQRKADWAYAELKALILYAYRSGFDPLTLLGSIYGAIGLCQFIPSNILPYGIDADHDGRIDLFTKG